MQPIGGEEQLRKKVGLVCLGNKKKNATNKKTEASASVFLFKLCIC
jgi:hypothetical protein